jgi:IclR family acetate operon transcriptional repressor
MSEIGLQRRPRGRPRTQPANQQPSTIQALDRGLLLLRTLAKERSLSLTDVALRVGMPPSTAHRVLFTLQRHGLADFQESAQEWSIGIEAFRIGNSYLVRTNLVEVSRNVMRRLMEDTGETANLAVADNGEVVFVSQVETQNPIRAFFSAGMRGQLHASGIGKALLAYRSRREIEQILEKKGLPEFTPNTLNSPEALYCDLETIRARGWSFDNEERYSGMRCVAAPIFNAFGEVIAGISVSGPTARFPDSAIAEMGPKVKRAADEVTDSIGGRKADTLHR